MAGSIEHLGDSALLRRISDEDADAAFEFVRRYEHRLIIPMACRILGDTADAEDVVSALLVRLLSSRRFSADTRWPPTNVREWLTTVVKRLALDVKRSRDAEWSRRSRLHGWRDPPPNPAEEAEHRETQLRIREALRGLPHKEREAIELLDLEDLPTAEACRRAGASRATLWRYRSRALRQLRQNGTLHSLITDDGRPLTGRA